MPWLSDAGSVGDIAMCDGTRSCRCDSSAAVAQLLPAPLETVEPIDQVRQTPCLHLPHSRLGYQGAAVTVYRSNPFAIDDEYQTGNSQDFRGGNAPASLKQVVVIDIIFGLRIPSGAETPRPH